MYRIIFVDEQKSDIDDFLDYVDAKNTRESFEVIPEFPLEDLDEMVDLILKQNPDAVITDFMLNEYKEEVKHNVPYNGVQLVQEILSIREGFPCFVMTSFDDDAIKVSNDVNLIYIKNILHGAEKDTKAKANFLERVENQINHYKSKIEESEKKLEELVKLRAEGRAGIREEQDIIELDNFLEMSIDKRNAIPPDYKSLSNTKRLEDILTKVDELLSKVDQKEDDQ